MSNGWKPSVSTGCVARAARGFHRARRLVSSGRPFFGFRVFLREGRRSNPPVGGDFRSILEFLRSRGRGESGTSTIFFLRPFVSIKKVSGGGASRKEREHTRGRRKEHRHDCFVGRFGSPLPLLGGPLHTACSFAAGEEGSGKEQKNTTDKQTDSAMVDQRSRKKSREVEANGQTRAGAQLWRLASQNEELKEFYQTGGCNGSIDAESVPSLDDDLLLPSVGGVLGMDPGNEALFFHSRLSLNSIDMEHDGAPAAVVMSAPAMGGPAMIHPHCSHGMGVNGELPIPFLTEQAAAQLLQSQPQPMAAGHPGGGVLPNSPFVDTVFPTGMVYTSAGLGMVKQEDLVKEEYPLEESMGIGANMDWTDPMELQGVDSLPEQPVSAAPPAAGCVFTESVAREVCRSTMFANTANAANAVNAVSVKAGQKSPGRSKGVTMCLRTLLRQLLAGTGWIMDSSISKDHATHLIRQLVGPSLDNQLEIQLTPRRAETMSSEDKENHYTRILADLVTRYTLKSVSVDSAQEFIKRDKGPYHLTQEFIDLLEGKQWPPHMLPEKELRKYGCYRQGEASKRQKGPE